MTMTVGQQLAPYVEEKPSEQEAVPCDMSRWWWKKGSHQDDCPNEATHTGICSVGCCTINACERCVNNHTAAFKSKNVDRIRQSEYIPLARRGIDSHIGVEVRWFPR